MGVLAVGLDGAGEVQLKVVEEGGDMHLALLREWFVGEYTEGVDRAEVDVLVVSLTVVEMDGMVLGKVVEVDASVWVTWIAARQDEAETWVVDEGEHALETCE